MARGGINKIHVKKARESLISKGQNPSIDTIRIELGNTGSKTTIHRYLKELEAEAGTRLDDEALLSETLKEIVASLAAKLHEEANAIVSKAEENNTKRKAEWQQLNDNQSLVIDTAEQRIRALEAQAENTSTALQECSEKLQVEAIKSHRLEQEVNDLKIMITDKDSQTKSLEEKHQHNRDALEHYRQSTKDQRDQDARRHESQIQQLQSEHRKLQQTLSVKQDNVTQLNKDNARLVTEVSEARKTLAVVESTERKQRNEAADLSERLTIESIKLGSSETLLKEKIESLDTVSSKLDEVKSEKQKLEIELARVSAELEVKNMMFEKVGITTK
ncbi:MAG: DNA-binding protein [Pseudomonadales bacterium]|nr:DNA-binding protein [Pseudomonadales bacterium]MBL4868589.1 DNA-binding protein [Pseudomonadales bacterium]